MEATLRSVLPGATICLDDGADLTPSGAPDSSGGTEGSAICTGSSTNWPALETGWSWDTTDKDLDRDGSNEDLWDPTMSDASFSYTANGDSKHVLCNQNGCTTHDSP